MCPYGEQLLQPEVLPSMLGGHCHCLNGCVGDWPNDSMVKPQLEQVPHSQEGLIALRRLPSAADLSKVCAPPPTTPVPAPAASCCRRCCKRRTPLADSVDLA